ncbi:hypothetical protein [Legionella cincinnatiensis]|uniref:Uncharacterized protein n=1 Tax=Legionella cincinnatiensis TaxID=28085 RepID=A0A378ILJ1_9GAMM|nr:hypothetical protein [Legionella cincinnatiensis]KTC83096.1 hypothetical protein Lcin_2468 [Legionella cincinnatiensis]STX35863.1 Uncharacterised protein [Legionella cincinnatiensis]
MSNSKWDEIHRKSQIENPKSEQEKELENKSDAIDTEVELRTDILNTRIGAMDTRAKVEAQKHNLGPKDTAIENDESNAPKP